MRIALEDWTAIGTIALASLLSCLAPCRSVQAADGADARVYEVVAPTVLVIATRLRPCRGTTEHPGAPDLGHDADCDDDPTLTASSDRPPVSTFDEKRLPR